MQVGFIGLTAPPILPIAYGPAPEQVGDLDLPAADNAPLLCLFHKGVNCAARLTGSNRGLVSIGY